MSIVFLSTVITSIPVHIIFRFIHASNFLRNINLIKDKLEYDESQYISNLFAQLNFKRSNYLRLIRS